MGRPIKEGGTTEVLISLEVGDSVWVECTLEDYAAQQRVWNPAISRRPAILKDRKFTTQLFTAVSTSKAGDIHYLLRVERT